MKIVVYAITKNEEKFAKRWIDSMKEADKIYVLDTGSTDNTVNILKENNVIVKEKQIKPFRFDIARNESLNIITEPADIYVCTDLDEVFNPGWRKNLEKIWKENTTRCRYFYNWSFDENNKSQVTYYLNKIHTKDYKWKDPVHEYLVYNGNKKENIITTDEIILNHYPDKTKSRSNYLPLLELAVKENPNDERHLHYLGREYMYYKEWNKSIDTLIKHLNIAKWKEERSASMRFIARCYTNLKRYEEANMWLEKAIKETPYLRDPYMEKALLAYQQKNFKEVKINVLKALKILKNENKYINEPYSWNETPYDLLSLAYYYGENDKEKALFYMKKALEINPQNNRIKNNIEIIQNQNK